MNKLLMLSIVYITCLSGCANKFTVKTTFVNKDAEVRVIETEYSGTSYSDAKSFAFFSKLFKFVNDELMYKRAK